MNQKMNTPRRQKFNPRAIQFLFLITNGISTHNRRTKKNEEKKKFRLSQFRDKHRSLFFINNFHLGHGNFKHAAHCFQDGLAGGIRRSHRMQELGENIAEVVDFACRR